MLTVDEIYLDMLDTIHTHGVHVETRGENCKRVRGLSHTFHSAPLVGVRRTAWRSALHEWEWFMSGSNNVYHLYESVQKWWAPWADNTGCVPFNYSEQFRRYPQRDGSTLDQVAWLIDSVTRHPYSRRNIITTWHTGDMINPRCPITNCHGTIIHAFVDPMRDGSPPTLHLLTYQRSCDMVCGVPHNWIQYWAFLTWLAHCTGFAVGSLQWIGGDVHVYEQHAPMMTRLLSLRGAAHPRTPNLLYAPHRTGSDTPFYGEHFTLDGDYMPTIRDSVSMIVGRVSDVEGNP